jgi:hypothetical protein
MGPERRRHAARCRDPYLVDIRGGRINQTLKYAIEWEGRWKVVPDNFALKIEGDGVSLSEAERVAGILRADGFWEAAATRSRMLSAVPEYRLSKFQRVLPASLQVEMVGGTCWTSRERGGASVLSSRSAE